MQTPPGGILEVIKSFCVVTAALFLLTPPASAHHAFAAMYDEHKLVTVSGTVTKLEWVNPHVWLYVDGKDEGGKTGHWKFEMGSPGGLISRGWEKTTLKTGDQITVDGYRARDGSKVANPRTVTLPDGRKLFGGFQSTPGAPVK
jgi:uncharacterized protein DUF6152